MPARWWSRARWPRSSPAPRHPYTAALLSSIPESDAERLTAIPGTVPRPDRMPAGCRFHPRCAHAAPACQAPQALLPAGPGRVTRCIRWQEVT